MKKVKRTAVTLSALTTLFAGSISLFSPQAFAESIQPTVGLTVSDLSNITLITDAGIATITGSAADENQKNSLNVDFDVPEGQTEYLPNTSTKIKLTISNGTFINPTGMGELLDNNTVYSEVIAGIPTDFTIEYVATSNDFPVNIIVDFGASATNIIEQDRTGQLSIPVVDQALIDAKKTAEEIINELPNLSQADKDEYNKKVTEAKNQDEINNIVGEAEAANAAVIIPGDINGDGIVNQSDLDMLNDYLLFHEYPEGVDTEKFNESADVNQDGKVNQEDASALSGIIGLHQLKE